MIILRQHTFSEEPEQKEFNSKAAKALRNTFDEITGAKALGNHVIGLSNKEIKKVGRLVNKNTAVDISKSKVGEKAKDRVNGEINFRGTGDKYITSEGAISNYHNIGDQLKELKALKSKDKKDRIINKILHPFKKNKK